MFQAFSLMSYDSEEVIFKETILNAYKYKKANAKIVTQKIFAYYPELRKEAKNLLPKIQEKVVEINSYSWEKIEEIVTNNYSEDIETEEKKRDYLPEMKDAVQGKVKVRYPPEPSKAPHIGQMLSFCINHLVAERYAGKRVLRFDDTNPDTVKIEFYEQFREAISWLGLPIDEEIIASNHMNTYYTKAREMLENEQAYVCKCDRETIAKLRDEQKRCSCHKNHSIEKNIELFEKILENNFSPGEVIIRLKGDMESQNSALKDPVLLRISDTPHCLHGDKYILWPMYDFESPIMEHITKVTHIFRSIEFGKMREELQQTIAKRLGLNIPKIYEYSRFNIVGAPTKGREIRELVEKGIVSGWDDIRLVTFQALKKRGIQPQTITEIIKKVGTTKSTTTIDWSLINAINRKIIEPTTKHFFFVRNPIKINIINPERITKRISVHPYNSSLGTREINIYNRLYLDGDDSQLIQPGKILRMKDLYNIKIIEQKAPEEFEAEVLGNEMLTDIQKIQWVSEPVNVYVKKADMLYLNNGINKDSLKYIQGYGEKHLRKLEVGSIVQLERFGYVIITDKNGKISMNYIHG